MLVRGIDHINITAPAALLERCRDFYVSVLGLIAGERPPFRSRGYWLYADGRPIVHLTEIEESSVATDHTGAFNHIALRCGPAAAMIARLEQHAIGYRKSGVPGSDVVQLFVRDPAGIGVELTCDA